jgi:hypothetical protein
MGTYSSCLRGIPRKQIIQSKQLVIVFIAMSKEVRTHELIQSGKRRIIVQRSTANSNKV